MSSWQHVNSPDDTEEHKLKGAVEEWQNTCRFMERTNATLRRRLDDQDPDPGAGPKSGSPSFWGGFHRSKYLGRVQMAKRDPTQNDRFCLNAELIWAVSFRKAAI